MGAGRRRGAAFLATAFFGAGFLAVFLIAFAGAAFLATFLAAFFATFLVAFLATFLGAAFFFGAAVFAAFGAVFLAAAFLAVRFGVPDDFAVRFFAICPSFSAVLSNVAQAGAIIDQVAAAPVRAPDENAMLGDRSRVPAIPLTPMPDTTKAVILARGLGTRMRKPVEGTAIDSRQAAVADTGVKAMIPIRRPFLDYVLQAVADAGCRDVCLIIGPEHTHIRQYYGEVAVPRRLRVSFAVQEQPLGTANAVQAAEGFAGADPFLALNSDNFYPAAVLARLRALGGPGLIGFARSALLSESNIEEARVLKYAVAAVDRDGCLADIVEKPDAAIVAAMGPDPLISMNCWSLGPSIFEAARRIERSPRGEFELTDAVKYSITRLGERYQVIPVKAGVLDLSMRSDIPSVVRRLEDVDVRL